MQWLILRLFGDTEFSRGFWGSCDVPRSSQDSVLFYTGKNSNEMYVRQLKSYCCIKAWNQLNILFNTKSSLIWSFKLSHTVTKLFKQYDWVIWLISTNILSCKFWYIMVPVMEKLSLGEFTCVSILLANQIHMFECWYLCIVKKSFWHYNWLIFSNSFWYATDNMIQKS